MRRGLIPVCAWICRSETPSASSKSTRARRTSPAERLVVRSICSKRSRSVGCSRKASWEVNMNSHIPYIASCVIYLCNTTLVSRQPGPQSRGDLFEIEQGQEIDGLELAINRRRTANLRGKLEIGSQQPRRCCCSRRRFGDVQLVPVARRGPEGFGRQVLLAQCVVKSQPFGRVLRS